MTVIRTAIIGLSANAATSWASNAHLPYLLSPRGRKHYKITALCNTSVQAAQKAIEKYFPDDTDIKAYGDAQSLAADTDIDLVVCCTRVDVHHLSSFDAVKSYKNVFIEWPLAQDASHASELTQAIGDTGKGSIVGLQGRFAPPVVRIKELLDNGDIGRILSSEVRAFGGTNDREAVASGLEYFSKREVGGNVYTIGLGHLFDQVQHVLGDIQNLNGNFQLQRPELKLLDLATREITGTAVSTVPDLIIATGTLEESPISVANATVLVRFRRGQPFKSEAPLIWTINGEKGELRLVAEGGTTLHASAYTAPVTIEIHDFATDEVRTVPWKWEDWQEELPMVSRSVGVLYERFAQGESVPTFSDALLRHNQLEGMLSHWEA